MEVKEVDEIYYVQSIKAERKLKGKAKEYLVVWKGYEGGDTWEPLENIEGRADEALEVFKRKQAGQSKKKRKKGDHDDH